MTITTSPPPSTPAASVVAGTIPQAAPGTVGTVSVLPPTVPASQPPATALPVIPAGNIAGIDSSNVVPVPNYKLNERLAALENANKHALSQNQALALKNDNLRTQVLSLQSDRGTQMFLYGALIMLAGLLIGYIVGRSVAARQRSFWR